MSIDISRHTEKRSERTLMCPLLLRRVRGTGPRATGTEARFFGACEGQALALRVSGRVSFVVRGPSRLYQREASVYPTCGVIACRFSCIAYLAPQSLPHPGHPVHLGHPASDARDIKDLTDLFSLLLLRFYRHEGLPDLCTVCCLILLILFILQILAILLQTNKNP